VYHHKKQKIVQQGKQKQQRSYSETIVYYGFLAMLALLIVQKILNLVH
jgi:hypothetical protein